MGCCSSSACLVRAVDRHLQTTPSLLGGGSAWQLTVCVGTSDLLRHHRYFFPKDRWWAKNSWRMSRHSDNNTPPSTAAWWLSRLSAVISYRV